jgi:molybdate transport system substrate-binding protein
MRKKLCLMIIGLISLFTATGCAGPSSGSGSQITIFAASSLTDAFEELAAAFEAGHPGVMVIRSYASSSQLAAQLLEGIPADVYASANEKQMQAVMDGGLVDGQPRIFASNRLTVIVPEDNPAGLSTPHDLEQPGLALALAAPETPIRFYSDQVIAMLGGEDFQAAVYANLISEEPNVRQVVTKVALGEADAGMVYTSDVTPDVAGRVQVIPIPDEYNVTASYPIASINTGSNFGLAQQFITFVLSAEGQAILQSWGFGSIQ